MQTVPGSLFPEFRVLRLTASFGGNVPIHDFTAIRAMTDRCIWPTMVVIRAPGLLHTTAPSPLSTRSPGPSHPTGEEYSAQLRGAHREPQTRIGPCPFARKLTFNVFLIQRGKEPRNCTGSSNHLVLQPLHPIAQDQCVKQLLSFYIVIQEQYLDLLDQSQERLLEYFRSLDSLPGYNRIAESEIMGCGGWSSLGGPD